MPLLKGRYQQPPHAGVTAAWSGSTHSGGSGQHLGAPAGVVGGPGVAAADAAGHAVVVVGAVDVVPADVAA